jgi:hypothetical protein
LSGKASTYGGCRRSATALSPSGPCRAYVEPLQGLDDGGLLHGRRGRMAGDLMRFGKGGQAAGHRSGPVGRSQQRQAQRHGLGGRGKSQYSVLVAPACEVIPVGTVSAEGERRFGGADELSGLVLGRPLPLPAANRQ